MRLRCAPLRTVVPALALLLLAPAPRAEPPAPPALVILRGATLYDGTGRPGRKADLAIKGERIVAVGQVKVGPGARVIDADGLVAAPGFIDLHTHSDDALTARATR